ncbi:UDP-N-acetyl-D-mannosamine dehydrogenase / UDP-glucose 6-dehydrogenase [Paramecium bursaria Chlorella virus CZ-2]|nr:UDP-N-acetyl-D-mannosamine dehydrogenase / UDP-glucose 6-dehydrogenase [Paramecium bursaria Chlorella virus CZ-2]
MSHSRMSRITVVGSGYVGSALAVMLARHNKVIVLDISQERVDKINARVSPIEDKHIDAYFSEHDLNLKATTDKTLAYAKAEFVIVATPTNYNEETGNFDTRSVESVIDDVMNISSNPSYIVIKSTIPVGFVDSMREKYSTKCIAFSPEFLREGSALQDNLYPSRIVVGDDSSDATEFAELLAESSYLPDVPRIFMGPREAESVKLFANTYLAMRVAFFNELDTFALWNKLSCADIIRGVTLDPRIGAEYCNPSFGYGGYCLPKDTKQLQSNFIGIPQSLVSSIVESNIVRKQAIVDAIVRILDQKKNRKNKNRKNTVGIYRLAMKTGSDNSRDAAVLVIASQLRACGVEVVVHDPAISSYEQYTIDNDVQSFTSRCDLIIANRVDDEHRVLFGKKLFTRDVFSSD